MLITEKNKTLSRKTFTKKQTMQTQQNRLSSVIMLHNLVFLLASVSILLMNMNMSIFLTATSPESLRLQNSGTHLEIQSILLSPAGLC